VEADADPRAGEVYALVSHFQLQGGAGEPLHDRPGMFAVLQVAAAAR
jgi:hypothetical protein